MSEPKKTNRPSVVPLAKLGDGFVPPSNRPANTWRALRAEEIDELVRLGNTSDDWQNVRVADPFNPTAVRGCQFFGLVRIGRQSEHSALEDNGLRVPVGLANSRIVSCDLGDDVAISNVRHMAHMIVGDGCWLTDIDELYTTPAARFGQGCLKDGEPESARGWLELINEGGNRHVLAFADMTAGDAYLWAKYRDDAALLARLQEITQRSFDSRPGMYGTIGDGCVIRSSRILRDVNIGPCARIEGANRLEDLTVHSTPEEPTQIGDGVELVSGIVGRGCRVLFGAKGLHFVLAPHCTLQYGARLIHTFLGDNSTVACCEVQHSLIFPAHEQHHNNSFMIASLVMGQSNLAAGATIGSNHNSRAPDGEIVAGRGFWPGLCVSLKHNGRFASYTLLAKGDYPHELDIPLPFSLVSDDPAQDRLIVMPAYWFLYNMYAVARNMGKFQARDKRIVKDQAIEFDTLAPDTAEEMLTALALLEQWTAKAWMATQQAGPVPPEHRDCAAMAEMGRRLLLLGPDGELDHLEVLGERMENSRRKVVILKAPSGYRMYRDMLNYYAVRNLLNYLQANPRATFQSMLAELDGPRERRWVNLGGQLLAGTDLEQLKARIKDGRLDSWSAIHQVYRQLWAKYPRDKQRHAMGVLSELHSPEPLTLDHWHAALDQALVTQRFIADQTYASRKKDFDNPFRKVTFDSPAEMRAVLGEIGDNSFIGQIRKETEEFAQLVQAGRKGGGK